MVSPPANPRPPEYTGPNGHHGPAWFVQAAHIARRCLIDGRSKVEVAEETGLSRFKVARILDEARALGLVRVSVSVPGQIDADLSSDLATAYGLTRAVVINHVSQEEQAIRQAIADTAAALVSEIVGEDDVLGLSCSRTVDAMARRLTTLAPCRVVQLTGTLANSDIDSGSVESVRRAATVGGGKAFPIYAPMLVPDAATAQGLAQQSGIAPVMGQFGDVTKAIIAVGAWSAGHSTIYAAVTADDGDRATAAGAVGEIGGRLFDSAGHAVQTSIDSRVLGITLEQLQQIDEVICAAFGAERGKAVQPVITSGVVNSLVCDAALARALLGITSPTTGSKETE